MYPGCMLQGIYIYIFIYTYTYIYIYIYIYMYTGYIGPRDPRRSLLGSLPRALDTRTPKSPCTNYGMSTCRLQCRFFVDFGMFFLSWTKALYPKRNYLEVFRRTFIHRHVCMSELNVNASGTPCPCTRSLVGTRMSSLQKTPCPSLVWPCSPSK